MDYNDMKGRLSRTLSSLKGRFDEDIQKHANYHFYNHSNELRVSITFGTEDESILLNPILIILHNLASLKDNLKNSFVEKGLDPSIVENEIENSLHLKVLIDIVNQEKHGSPIKKNRSGRLPMIKNASQSFRLGSKIRDEEGKILSNEGPPTMFIDALIKDEHGNLLFSLDDLIETCYSRWIKLVKQHGLN